MDVKRGAVLCPASAAVPLTLALGLLFLLAAFSDEEEPALVAAGALKIGPGGVPAQYAGLTQESRRALPRRAAGRGADGAVAAGIRFPDEPGQVVIRPPDGMYSQYTHLSQLNVRPGQSVDGGRRIARSGSTGNSSGPHLHFEIRTTPEYGSDIDPIPYLRHHGLEV